MNKSRKPRVALAAALLSSCLLGGCELELVESSLTASEFNGHAHMIPGALAVTDYRDDGDIDWYAIHNAETNEMECRCAVTHQIHGTYPLGDWRFTGSTLAETTFEEFVWVGLESDTISAPRVTKLNWTCSLVGYGSIATPNASGHKTYIQDLTSDADGNPWILVRRSWPSYPSYDVNALYTALPTSGGYHYIWPEHELDGDIPPEHFDTQASMVVAHDDYDDSLNVLVDDDAPAYGWVGVYDRVGSHNTAVGNELFLASEVELETEGVAPVHDLAVWKGFRVMAASDGIVTFEDDVPSSAFDMSAGTVAIVPEKDPGGSWSLPSIYAEGRVFSDPQGSRIHRFALEP